MRKSPLVEDLDGHFVLQELEAAHPSTKRSSSTGLDVITYSALFHLGIDARERLLIYFNETWTSGNVPPIWKIARIVPLLKPRKSRNALSSYRPIVLPSCIAKVMEEIILARIVWFLEYNDLYADMMLGFRRGRCAINNILD